MLYPKHNVKIKTENISDNTATASASPTPPMLPKSYPSPPIAPLSKHLIDSQTSSFPPKNMSNPPPSSPGYNINEKNSFNYDFINNNNNNYNNSPMSLTTQQMVIMFFYFCVCMCVFFCFFAK